MSEQLERFFAANPPPAADASREAHHAYADRHGFFWLPCPRCGRYFGGHEWSRASGHSVRCQRDEYTGHGTCCLPIGAPDDAEVCERVHLHRGD